MLWAAKLFRLQKQQFQIDMVNSGVVSPKVVADVFWAARLFLDMFGHLNQHGRLKALVCQFSYFEL